MPPSIPVSQKTVLPYPYKPEAKNKIFDQTKIAVVIPAYKCKSSILSVLSKIGPEVNIVYVVDDGCPEGTGNYVKAKNCDPRVAVLFNEINQGVGGAVIHGYKKALENGADIIVKIDGDGQMDPALISSFVRPILNGHCDYTKGNRFFYLEDVKTMPKVRLFGNSVLSFMNKISSGYWNIFDPTNGFTAISSTALKNLNFEKISKRYFFESDLLFHLNLARAVVFDVPMKAKYAEEKSNLVIKKILGEFLLKHFINFNKRIFYTYFLRSFSIGSLELLVGSFLLLFGTCYGLLNWINSLETHIPATSGTVMLAALPIILGIQFLLSFLQEDIAMVPKIPLISTRG